MADVTLEKDGKGRVVGTPAKVVELQSKGWKVVEAPEPEQADDNVVQPVENPAPRGRRAPVEIPTVLAPE